MDYMLTTNNIIILKRIYEDESESGSIFIEWFDAALHKKDGANIHSPYYQNHNVYQRSKTNKHGDLFLMVSEKGELDSMFSDEIVNADDYTVYRNGCGQTIPAQATIEMNA